MKQSLDLLVLSRNARREKAIAESAAANRQFDKAIAKCEEARVDVERCVSWRAQVLSQCRLGNSQALRESLLPSCEALLLLHQQQFTQQQTALREAHEHLIQMRRNLASRERDRLRLDEWSALQQASAQREQAIRQDLDDEESSCTRKHGLVRSAW